MINSYSVIMNVSSENSITWQEKLFDFHVVSLVTNVRHLEELLQLCTPLLVGQTWHST